MSKTWAWVLYAVAVVLSVGLTYYYKTSQNPNNSSTEDKVLLFTEAFMLVGLLWTLSTKDPKNVMWLTTSGSGILLINLAMVLSMYY